MGKNSDEYIHGQHSRNVNQQDQGQASMQGAGGEIPDQGSWVVRELVMLDQEEYVKYTLKKYGMADCKPKPTSPRNHPYMGSVPIDL